MKNRSGTFHHSSQFLTNRHHWEGSMNLMVKLSVKLASLAAALSACAVSANASLITTLQSETPDLSNFAFNYTATVAADERLDPAATSGATCGGIQCNPPGTFFTIYDIPGFVSATAPPGWTEMTQNTGITPSTINGTLFDSPAVPNVTFMYTGPVVAGAANISGFTIVSTDSAITLAGDFTSQSTNNVGSTAGTTDQLFGSVPIPAEAPPTTPLPATLPLFAAGLGALGLLGWRRKRKARVSLLG